jgi:HEAT repeat protein
VSAVTGRAVLGPDRAALVAGACAGDGEATVRLLEGLASPNKVTQSLVMQAVRRAADPRLWQTLLESLALEGPIEAVSMAGRAATVSSRGSEAAIIELFVDSSPDSPAVRQEVLHSALKDPRLSVRITAASLLGLQGDARAADLLVDGLGSVPPAIGARAVNALGVLRLDRSAAVLVEALRSEHEELHHAATHALSGFGPGAVSALAGALRAPQGHVRWHAARALGQIGHASASEPLAGALSDPDSNVRFAAAEALAEIGFEAVPSFLDRLTRHAAHEAERQAARHLINSLHADDLKARLQPLLDVLYAPGGSSQVQIVAARLLQAWRDPS